MARKVFVGLSGGVDSAVSAALLKKCGYDVEGVFIKIWRPEFTECTWQEDRLDAMRVAVHLDIPFREIDLSEEYKKGIIDGMTAAYARGITPNPDVLCNKEIKFGSFLRYALREGADAVATGHYARVEKENCTYKLLRGTDASKDQSYFLHTLGQEELSHALFPVGGFEKNETRRLAEQFGLPVARKKDSQGLCFVGAIAFPDFLSRFLPLARGPVFDMAGDIIGEHDGAALYTIGQRHGFRLTDTAQKGPHFVFAVDAAKNNIRVSARRADAESDSCTLEELHFVGSAIEFPFDASAQARYHGESLCAAIVRDAGTVRAEFSAPALLTRGQSLVLYHGEQCIGGGIIADVGRKSA